MLQDCEQPLLDPPEQLQAHVEAVSPQETQGGGQVSALQQELLCREGRAQGLPPFFPPSIPSSSKPLL